MLSNLLHAKLVWMPSGCYAKLIFAKLCLFVFGATLAIGNLAAWIVTSVFWFLSVRDREDRALDAKSRGRRFESGR